MPSDSSDDLVRYEIQLTERAEMDIESAYLGRMKFGLAQADRWHEGLHREIERLSLFPNSYPPARERATVSEDLRQMIYGKGTSAYRIIFRVIEATESEIGIVRILHVRHASQRALGEDV